MQKIYSVKNPVKKYFIFLFTLFYTATVLPMQTPSPTTTSIFSFNRFLIGTGALITGVFAFRTIRDLRKENARLVNRNAALVRENAQLTQANTQLRQDNIQGQEKALLFGTKAGIFIANTLSDPFPSSYEGRIRFLPMATHFALRRRNSYVVNMFESE